MQVLQAVHARGIVHGDTHVHNWQLRDGGQLCLVDWASARLFADSQLPGSARAQQDVRNAEQSLKSFCGNEGVAVEQVGCLGFRLRV